MSLAVGERGEGVQWVKVTGQHFGRSAVSPASDSGEDASSGCAGHRAESAAGPLPPATLGPSRNFLWRRWLTA